MQQIQVTAIFPIHCLLGSVKSTEGLIRQLPQLSGLSCKLRFNKKKSITVNIRGLSARESKTVLSGRFSHLSFGTFRLVEFHTATTFKPEDSFDKQIGLFYSEIQFAFGTLLERLVIASNIARPGSMSILGDGVIFSEESDYFVEFPTFKFHNWLASLTDTRDISHWPKVKLMRLDKVWKWLNCLPDFEKGYGSSPLGRALAAFTHLISLGVHDSSLSPSPLTYLISIVGLESIYESNGSQRMLKERCGLFLNDSNEDKKLLDGLIKELYERRSSIIHGGMNIPFKFGDDESSAESENSWEKVSSLDAATPILVATFQKMALLNIHQLHFELRLKKKAE